MSDHPHAKSGSFLNKATKQLVRTKAKVLQNLGKADKTTDETFHTHVQNFHKIQENVTKLQKNLKNYIMCAKGLAIASKDLGDILTEIYEPSFPDHANMNRYMSDMELMWSAYLVNLEDQCADQIINFQQPFPDVKLRIAKRGRKMVDYDNARHNVEYLINAKKQDPPKIAKGQEELHDSKKIYEQLNNELLLDLPDLYNSRISFYSQLLQNIFSVEQLFHDNVAKTNLKLIDMAERLANLEVRVTSNDTRQAAEDIPIYDNKTLAEQDSPRVVRLQDADSFRKERTVGNSVDTSLHDMSGVNLSTLEKSNIEKTAPPLEDLKSAGDSHCNDYENIATESLQLRQESKQDAKEKPTPPSRAEAEPAETKETSNTESKEEDTEEGVYQTPCNEPLSQPPSDCLFQVIVSHPYHGEDSDELSLVPGEIVYVIPCENPDDQDVGWLYGLRQTDGKRGFFPENFTRRM